MGSGCFLRCAGVAHLGKLIDLYSYPVRTAMRFLLEDKTTGENIIWATNTYERYGDGYRQDNQITPELISGVYANLIQPRILKAEEEQAARTKSKAEVFTPSWVVCYMNNKCDDDWFGRENVFNTLNGEHWEPTKEPVYFEKERDWQRYVDSRRLEITCGEAPYLVSRYDAATGEGLPIESRIGILDRKLRVVNENTDNERVSMFIQRSYINAVKNLDSYKIFLPKASGVGEFGEALAPAIIAMPGVGHTETFFSIGNFSTLQEAENLLTVYIDATYSIDPQARTATPIVNPQ